MRIVEQFFKPLVGPDAKMKIAVNADLKILFKFLLIEVRRAFVTPHKDIFGAHDAIFVAYRLDLTFLFAEPGHRAEVRSPNSGHTCH